MDADGDEGCGRLCDEEPDEPHVTGGRGCMDILVFFDGSVQMSAVLALLLPLASPVGAPDYVAAARTAATAAIPPPRRLVSGLELRDSGASGVRRLNQVRQYIRDIPLKMAELGNTALSDKQQAICALFVQTAIAKIVTVRQWVTHRRMFLDLLGVCSVSNMGGVLASRQNGKTWTIAVCCAAVMLTCQDITIGVYSSKIAQSEYLQGYVVQIFKALNVPLHTVKSDHVIYVEGAGVERATMSCFGFNA